MIELANGVTLPDGAVVQSIVCHMDNAREYSAIVERIQYDKTLPVIEVYLSSGGSPYKVPEGATVSVRLRKGDGKGVYNPALGLSEDRTRAYITVTQQMTAVPGDCRAVVEVAAGDGVICASEFLLKVSENPVQEGAVESNDEYLTLTQTLAQVQQMHGDVEAWKDQTLDYKKQTESMAINAVASADRAATSAANAAISSTQADISAKNAADSAAQAEGASEHYPTISSDGYWQLWDPAAQKYVKTTQKAQGPVGPEGPPVDTSALISQAEKGTANGVTQNVNGSPVNTDNQYVDTLRKPILIGNNQDLNNYKAPGRYYCDNTEHINNLKNVPAKRVFSLEVTTSAEAVIQRFTSLDPATPETYERRWQWYGTQVWYPWKTMLGIFPGNQNSINFVTGLIGLKQEEGVWTPVLAGTDGTGFSYNITSNLGCYYHVIGDMVYITAALRLTVNLSSTPSYMRVTGLPFAAAPGQRYVMSICDGYGIVDSAIGTLRGYIGSDANQIHIQGEDGAPTGRWVAGSGGLSFSAIYKKAT